MSAICAGFVPHAVKATRCKRCFRELSEHQQDSSTVSTPQKVKPKPKKLGTQRKTSVGESGDGEKKNNESLDKTPRRRREEDNESDKEEIKKSNRRSRELNSSQESEPASVRRRRNDAQENGSSKRVQILDTKEVDRSISPSMFGNNILPPETSNEVTSPDVEFILKVKTSTQLRELEETESLCATETTETTLTFNDTIEDLQNTTYLLKTQLDAAEERVVRLQKEKDEILKRRIKTEKDDAAMDKMASEVLKLRSEINKLSTINEESKDENNVLRLEIKELQEEVEQRQAPEVVNTMMNQLKAKLHQTENLCEELMEENKTIKQEISELEEEIDEMQDNFREEQADEYRDLRKELETTSKNCRVLQFKLRKTEKKCEELDEEKNKLADSLSDMQKFEADKLKVQELTEELQLAKEVSKQLTLELDDIKKKDSTLSQAVDTRSISPNIKDMSRELSPNRPNAGDSGQLMRDLYDAIERENDLKEQLKFSEETVKMTRKKMTSLEQENESLLLQVRKMAQSRSGKHPKDESGTDETSNENLKLQLELNDQEMTVLRKRFDETDSERENLRKEVEFLKEKISNQPIVNIDLSELKNSDLSDDCKYHVHQIRVLQNEAKDLRRKLIDKERDNDRLKTEVEVLRKKGSKVMVRSRSLDGDLQVDLKRQLQLVEQEVSILRQKSSRLETENEKLVSENRRLNLRLSRKPPPSTSEQLQVENLELRERIEELQEKVKQLLEEVKPTPEQMVEVVRRGSLTDSEQELISSLKKRVKVKETEVAEIQTRCAKFEIENNKLGRELKKLRDRMISVKKRDHRKVRDDATRMDLREIIQDLEEEISDLYISLRGRETIQESLQEQLDKEKKEQDATRKDLEQRCTKLTEENFNLGEEKRIVTLKLDAVNEELRKVETKTVDLDSSNDQTFQLESLRSEKKELEEEVSALKVSFDEKLKLLSDLEHQVEKLNTDKDKATDKNKAVESQKKNLQKELKNSKESNKKLELKLKEAKEELQQLKLKHDKVQEEYNTAQSQLDANKSRLKSVDNRQTEVAVGWLKEREELKNKLTEANEKAEQSLKQLSNIEENSRLKEEEILAQAKKEAEESVIEDREIMQKEIEDLTSNLDKMKSKQSELTDQLQQVQKDAKEAQDKQKKLLLAHRKEKEEWQNTEADLEANMKSFQRKLEKLERDHKHEMASKDEDLLITKDKLVKVERDLRRTKNRQEEMEQDYQDKVKNIEKELNKEKQEYEDLTAKYDLLEEDYVVVKAKLVMEKEKIEANFIKLKQEHETLEGELHTVRDTFNARQDSWIKDKLDKEEKLKELTAKVSRSEGWEVERIELRETLNQNSSLIDSYKKEEKHLKKERDGLRRQVEDQTRIMAELQKMATRIGQTGGDESENIQNIRKEKDQIVSLMGEEIQTMQKQIMSFQQERDAYKDQLKALQQSVDNATPDTNRNKDGSWKLNSTDSEKVSELQYFIEDLEDQLSGKKLEMTNLHTEYLAERSRWKIELAELKTKLNQFEEQNLIDGLGRSSRMLAKTKLELAWEKERSEQQRLLAESRRLITDLGDKLITVETLRDKEKSDAKRQLQNLKDTIEGERGDTRKKIGELHHGLSSSQRMQENKLRKNQDVEKEEMRSRLAELESHHSQLSDLISEVEKLSVIAPEALEESSTEVKIGKETHLTPYRGRPPLIKAASEDNRRAKEEFQEMLHNILMKTEELKKVQVKSDKTQRPYRRTLSASNPPARLPGISSYFDEKPYQEWSSSKLKANLPSPPPSMYINPPTIGGNLHRKSLSLQDQSTNTESSDTKIWLTDTSDVGSIDSISSAYDRSLNGRNYGTMPVRPERRSSERRRRTNVDNQVEPAAQQTERRSRKSVKDKLKTLVSSKSIEGSSTGQTIASVGKLPASVGIGAATPETKKRDSSLSSKIKKAFKKPLSRSSSKDRDVDDEMLKRSTSPSPSFRRGKLEPQSSIESMTSTTSATVKPKKKSLLNKLTSSKRSRSVDIPD